MTRTNLVMTSSSSKQYPNRGSFSAVGSVRSVSSFGEETGVGLREDQVRCQLQFRTSLLLVEAPLSFHKIADAAGHLVKRVVGTNPPLSLRFNSGGSARRATVTCQRDLEAILRSAAIANDDLILFDVDFDKSHPKFHEFKTALGDGGEQASLLRSVQNSKDDEEEDDDVGTIPPWESAFIAPSQSITGTESVTKPLLAESSGLSYTRVHSPFQEDDDHLAPVQLTAPFACAMQVAADDNAKVRSPVKRKNDKDEGALKPAAGQQKRPPAPRAPFHEMGEEKKRDNLVAGTKDNNDLTNIGHFLTNPMAVGVMHSVLNSPEMRPVLADLADAVTGVLLKNASTILSTVGRELSSKPELVGLLGIDQLLAPLMEQLRRQQPREEEEEEKRDPLSFSSRDPSASFASSSDSSSRSYQPLEAIMVSRDELVEEQEEEEQQQTDRPYQAMKPTMASSAESQTSSNSPLSEKRSLTSATSLQSRSSAPAQLDLTAVQYEQQLPDSILTSTKSLSSSGKLRSFHTAPATSSTSASIGESVRYDEDDVHEDDACDTAQPNRPIAQLVSEGSDLEVFVSQTNPEGVVSWRIQNTGTTQWPARVELKQIEGDLMLMETIKLPSLGPGDITEISFPFRLTEASEFYPDARALHSLCQALTKSLEDSQYSETPQYHTATFQAFAQNEQFLFGEMMRLRIVVQPPQARIVNETGLEPPLPLGVSASVDTQDDSFGYVPLAVSVGTHDSFGPDTQFQSATSMDAISPSNTLRTFVNAEGNQEDRIDNLVQNLAESFRLDIPLVRDVLEAEGWDEARCMTKLEMLSNGA